MSHPRELLDTYAAEMWVTTLSERPLEEFAPKAFAALRAVLDLHQPTALGGALVCGRCRYDTGEPEPWPCPTVHAIMTALTGDPAELAPIARRYVCEAADWDETCTDVDQAGRCGNSGHWTR